MSRFKIIPALIAGILVLAGCASNANEAAPVTDFLTDNDLGGKTTTQIIDHLDQLGGEARPTNYMASIRADELLFITEDAEYEMEMPADEFYVSIAPFREETHPCTFHSLTTCQGELTGEDFQVKVVDDAGTVILDEARTSFENGFIGLWLPRDISGTIEITDSAGESGVVEFTTDASGATCITTLQLTAA